MQTFCPDACTTLGIHPSLSLHCKLNFSCIIVTEIISCRSVERVVERKRIHVLQEQITACFFGLAFSSFFFFLYREILTSTSGRRSERKCRDYREGSSSRVDSASYIPFRIHISFLCSILDMVHFSRCPARLKNWKNIKV